MKQVVVFDDLREFAVRPPEVFEEYIALLADDIARSFPDRRAFTTIPCPGCGASSVRPAFAKLTFAYVTCTVCGSVFVSPRPTHSAVGTFMATSRAADFWRSTVEAQTAQSRAQSIVLPRVAWIQSGARDMTSPVLMDLYSKYPLFLETARRSDVFSRVISVEPAVDGSMLARSLGVDVVETLQDALAAGRGAAVLSMQECLERDADPDHLVRSAAALLKAGGLLFLTTVTWSGFDLQMLGGRSKHVLPPTHLNLLSLEGIRRLLARHGFQIFELSTPGQLDVEIVRHAVADDPEIVLPSFVDELIRHRDGDVHRDFQRFLQKALLSSHVRLMAGTTGSEGSAG